MNATAVRVNNTVLRDGHQSLAATRMTTAQMLPAAGILDGMGFAGLETWGGAVIDSCLRYLGENPFDRLRALKQAAPRTPQIMLLRGQNIVQYASFPDDVVEAFVRCAAAAGQDVFRIFDALNDLRNLRTAIRAVLQAGKHARGEVCYTTSPVHTVEAFVKLGVELERMGCHSIGIKDMSGVLAPPVAAELVKALKQRVRVPIVLHSHDTAGLAAAAYYAAVEAGVDAIETSVSPFANGTGQPDTLRMLEMLRGHPRCPQFDRTALGTLQDYFTGVYAELGRFTSPANERVDSDTLRFQVPGGMLSNFRNQLKEQNMADRIGEVMAEMPVVREALGWIPLVTPTSQIVGSQAMLNVKFGRWKSLSQPAMDILLGKYGKTPGPVDPELQRQAIETTGQPVVEERPADGLKPRMEQLRLQLVREGLPTDDESAVLYAMFPQEWTKLKKGTQPQPAADAHTPVTEDTLKTQPSAAHSEVPRRLRLEVGGESREVQVQEVE